tara:strand:+ start:1615 stop:1776 length:162 start_codon:yes stop_codon:yes gene_type:complete
MIIPKEDENTGNCLPVSSCLFFAHVLRIKLDIKAKIKAIKTYEKPLSKTGLGE